MIYKSGGFNSSEYKDLPIYRLVQLYKEMKNEGVSQGLDPYSFPEITTFSSSNTALLFCERVYSSVVARMESNLSEGKISFSSDEYKPSKEHPPMSRPKIKKIDENAVLTLLVQHNPKKRTAAERFAHYRTGMTVKEYCDLVGNPTQGINDILWDSERNWVKFELASEEAA